MTIDQESAVTIFAFVVMGILAVIIWRMERKPPTLPPPSKDVERKNDIGRWT